ncbi:uncharacterized protein NPIL_668021 [Nephila pilipes]|uniref:Uncharacterized protein n=1 Tax=Nephila pilipes TaxID=299642 RepID=A0A8X6MMZ5_NEPPI|nr:uncharacterized protein NPIL_212711 [Nephila pilipes]GFU35511.1 uncharacterized protein NPIL_668021 [Nephila pilipes]
MIHSVYSLEQLAVTKIAIHIYNENDFNVLFQGSPERLRFLLAEEWEPILKRKLTSLKLPLILQKKVIHLIRPLSNEIDEWKLDHFAIIEYSSLKPPIEYVWKGKGKIDRLKTAANYIQCENYDIVKRFRMACVYWFQEEAKQLWKKMSKTTRKKLSFCPVLYFSRWKRAVEDWIALIESETVDWRMHSFSRSISWYCQDPVIIQGSLLQQLSLQDQSDVLKIVMKENIPTRTKSFCLSQLNAIEFEDVLKSQPLQIYKALLTWPYYLQFEEVVDRIFEYFTQEDFLSFLRYVILEKVSNDLNDYDYVELLNDLWKRCPNRFKQYEERSTFFKIFKMASTHDYSLPFKKRCQREIRRNVMLFPVYFLRLV